MAYSMMTSKTPNGFFHQAGAEAVEGAVKYVTRHGEGILNQVASFLHRKCVALKKDITRRCTQFCNEHHVKGRSIKDWVSVAKIYAKSIFKHSTSGGVIGAVAGMYLITGIPGLCFGMGAGMTAGAGYATMYDAPQQVKQAEDDGVIPVQYAPAKDYSKPEVPPALPPTLPEHMVKAN